MTKASSQAINRRCSMLTSAASAKLKLATTEQEVIVTFIPMFSCETNSVAYASRDFRFGDRYLLVSVDVAL